MNFLQKTIKNHHFISFIILAFSITWIGSSIYHVSFQKHSIELPAMYALVTSFIWYYGPCLAAIIVTRISKGSLGIQNLFKRMIQWRVSWGCYLFIVLYPVALHLSVVSLDYLINGSPIIFFESEGVPKGNLLLVLLGLILLQIFQRGIGEETGWRGFALPELLSNNSIFKSSFVLGLVWAAWHFHPANFQALLSETGIFVFVNIFLTTFLFSWLSVRTNASLLLAILFHMSLNLMEFIIPIGLTDANLTRRILQIGMIFLSVVLLFSYKPKDQLID